MPTRTPEELREKFSTTSLDDINFPICNDCKHLIPGTWRCSAYENGIPQEITTSQVDHKKPHVGDNGIQFEARE